MKRILVLVSFGMMALLLVGAYYCPNAFWQAVGINAATSFMALGVALIFVNVYLERSSRRGAVRSLLVLSHQAIADFHNDFLDVCWAKFGRDEWGKIGDEYLAANGKAEALRHDVRQFLYDTAKSNTDLKTKLAQLLETLTELSRFVGWDLDPRLLKACLDSRIAIGRLKDVTFDDSDDAIDTATEHLMDADIRAQEARHLLMVIAGVSNR